MNKKSFLGGVAVGIILTIVVLIVIGTVNQAIEETDPIDYLEHPVSYENKTTTSVKVFQVLDNAALAREAATEIGGTVMYYGSIVMILGKNFYYDQVITIKNPQRIGTYSYTTKADIPLTVPVLDGNISE